MLSRRWPRYTTGEPGVSRTSTISTVLPPRRPEAWPASSCLCFLSGTLLLFCPFHSRACGGIWLQMSYPGGPEVRKSTHRCVPEASLVIKLQTTCSRHHRVAGKKTEATPGHQDTILACVSTDFPAGGGWPAVTPL